MLLLNFEPGSSSISCIISYCNFDWQPSKEIASQNWSERVNIPAIYLAISICKLQVISHLIFKVVFDKSMIKSFNQCMQL